MAVEYYVLARTPLPGRSAPWSMVVESTEGALAISEDTSDDTRQFVKELVPELSFEPKSVIRVRKGGWELADVVAEVIASALDGLVTDDVQGGISLDAQQIGASEPPASLAELEERIRDAFTSPEPFLEAQEQREQRRRKAAADADPSSATENDWSEL